jgi:HEAT repeat protein
MVRKRGVKAFLFSGWRRWVTLGAGILVALLAIGLIVDAVAGKDIRVWWLLRDFRERLESREPGVADEAMQEIRDLGFPYKKALGRAVLRGGRTFNEQLALSNLLHDKPFFGREILEQALTEEEAIVRRAAAVALMSRETRVTGKPLPDELYQVIEDWCGDPREPWLQLGLMHSRAYRDPRLVDLLLPLLSARSQDYADAEDEDARLLQIGRVNRNRERIAEVLKAYISDPRVTAAFEEVVHREGEADRVQFFVWKALASEGYDEDPELYWIGARSENPFIRQTVAEHLERVSDPKVIPILKELLEDPHELVRNGAIRSLTLKKSPILMDDLYYLGEDSYVHTRGDLATAVGIYGRTDHIPYLIWCLAEEEEPNVVEKAVVELFKLTKKHHGFSDEEWDAYTWNRPLEPGGRPGLIRAFINDAERKEKAIETWSSEYPPRYTDRDRVPHLIRQLGHEDRDNVKRAIVALARITGRTEGFPEILTKPRPESEKEIQEEADAMFLFMTELRETVIADWRAWAETWRAEDD